MNAQCNTDLVIQVQHTLRKELVDATVITIAHRLRTVVGALHCKPWSSHAYAIAPDVDCILLLQDGVVREFGPPKMLLSKPESAFRELCRQSNELDELMRLAGMIP